LRFCGWKAVENEKTASVGPGDFLEAVGRCGPPMLSWDPAANSPGNPLILSVPSEVPRPISYATKRQSISATKIPGEKLEIVQKNPSVATSKRSSDEH
jgi:hypothetical protein